MAEFHNILKIFVIVLLCKAYEALKVYQRSFPEQVSGSVNHFTFEDGRYLYTNCRSGDNECQVFREKNAYENGTLDCKYTLKSEQQNGTVDIFKLKLTGFGSEKVIVGWEDVGDEKYIKYSIVNLNNCNTSVIKLLARENQTMFNDYQTLIHDDKFDIIFENENLCGEKLCRMIFNENGEVINGPEGYFENIGRPKFYKATLNDSSVQRYFFVKRENDETSYHLVKPDGSTEILTKVKNMLPPYHITTSQNMFGICYTTQLSSIFDTELKCIQYDNEGNLKLEMTNKDRDRTKMMRYMHNVPQGGFVFVEEDFANCEPNYCPLRYIAERWNSEGKPVGSLDLGQRCEDWKSRAWSSFFENENNEYCFAWACRTDYINQIHVTVKCFNDTDFT